MTVTELKNSICYNNIYHLLIFYGDELYIKQKYYDKINQNWIKTSTLPNLNNQTVGLIKKPMYYRIDGEVLFDEKNRKHWEEIKTNCLCSRNCYIFDFVTDDFLTKEFLEMFKDYIVQFNHVSDNLLLKYFSKSNLSEENLKELFKNNDQDYTAIENEIKKIKSYAQANKLSMDLSYLQLKKDEQIYIPLGDLIFNYTGAVTTAYVKNEYGRYREIRPEERIAEVNKWLYLVKKTGEPMLGIVKALYKNLLPVYNLELMSNLSKEEQQKMFETLGYSKGRVFFMNGTRKLFKGKLKEVLDLLQSIEAGSKIGDITDYEALDYLTVQLLK